MTILGIDLGTTNSACAIWRDGKPVLIPNRLQKMLTPSVVGIDDKGEMIVGETAKHRLISHPKQTVSVFKRFMGTQQSFSLGRKDFSPIELSALILKSLKEDAEAFLGEEITQAVISVPAYFNDIQRKATKQAGELAGLLVERLINEPTAAAMVYGLHESEDDTAFMILDLGGGTFDVTLVEFFAGVMEVHASSGDNFLGGEDFTHALVERFLSDNDLNIGNLNAREQQHVYGVINDAKHALTANAKVTVEPCLKQQKNAWELTRETFEQVSMPLLQRIRFPIEKTLRDSDTHPEDINQLVLVGGATRMQPFRSMVTKMFRRMPAGHIDPDLVVAMGTAIQAGLKEKNSDLDDVVLTDVCPYSLGTDVVNHNDASGKQGALFLPIIERNCTVPISIQKTLFTATDNQTRLNIGVYQGESRLVKNNVYLGELEVTVPKGPKGQESVNVRYSYDMNGLLEVDVEVCSTGKKASKTIINAPGALEEKDIEAAKEKLSKLKFHPRETEENRAVIARAERMYESALEDKRQYLQELITHFEAVLEKQILRDIEKARQQITERLDQLDNDRFF